MATVDKPPTQEEADPQEVARLVSEGKRVTDPDLRRRIQERAEEVRREMFAKRGVTNIAAESDRPRRMKYVLDVSVGIKWVMNEVDAGKARRIRDDFRNSIHELLAPDCCVMEAAHGLTKAERRGFITDSGKLWDELMLDCPELYYSITRPVSMRPCRAAIECSPAAQRDLLLQ